MTEDPAGNMWFACVHGPVFRFARGHFTEVPAPFAETGRYYSQIIRCDDFGNVWIGYNRGALGRVEGANTESPRIRAVSWAGGSVQSPIVSIVSDRQGRLYLGSYTGLWLLDPATGRAMQFASLVPALAGDVGCSTRDGEGNLWFGTDHGLVRYVPAANPFRDPPSVRFTRILSLIRHRQIWLTVPI
jgi:ligand-binding sensor domain-containing protein